MKRKCSTDLHWNYWRVTVRVSSWNRNAYSTIKKSSHQKNPCKLLRLYPNFTIFRNNEYFNKCYSVFLSRNPTMTLKSVTHTTVHRKVILQSSQIYVLVIDWCGLALKWGQSKKKKVKKISISKTKQKSEKSLWCKKLNLEAPLHQHSRSHWVVASLALTMWPENETEVHNWCKKLNKWQLYQIRFIKRLWTHTG